MKRFRSFEATGNPWEFYQSQAARRLWGHIGQAQTGERRRCGVNFILNVVFYSYFNCCLVFFSFNLFTLFYCFFSEE